MTEFNGALWFQGQDTTTMQEQLYKLGNDGTVTKWTGNPGSGNGLFPTDMTVFNGALWFSGETPTNGRQLFKLGNDGTVTQWTNVSGGLFPETVSSADNLPSTPLSVFDNALWYQGNTPTHGNELYKLGADGSFTFWADINPGADSSNPKGWATLGS
jgi:ELWxxDGT repeat protein